MKRSAFILLILFAFVYGFAQEEIEKAGYLRYPTIPPFTLLKPDSTNITRDNLSKNRKTLIIYFSPGCDHCRHQTDSILAHIKKFKDVQIIMATWQPLEELQTFYMEYHLSNYRNIQAGRDTKYFFQPFYKIGNLPFLVLYNNRGKLITAFEGTTGIDKILGAFHTRKESNL